MNRTETFILGQVYFHVSEPVLKVKKFGIYFFECLDSKGIQLISMGYKRSEYHIYFNQYLIVMFISIIK